MYLRVERRKLELDDGTFIEVWAAPLPDSRMFVTEAEDKTEEEAQARYELIAHRIRMSFKAIFN